MSKLDLFTLVNGPWLASHEIPEDRPVDGTFYALRDEAEANLKVLLEADEGLAGTLYRAFMDTDNLTDDLSAELAVIDTSSPTAFAESIGKLSRVGVSGFIGAAIQKDSESELAKLYLYQDGLGLPDEAYYHAETHAPIREAYVAHIERMFTQVPALADAAEVTPAQAAEIIMDLETQIAAGHVDVVAARDSLATYNPMPVAQLEPTIQATLAGAGVPEFDVVNMMPSATAQIEKLLNEVPLTNWRVWAIWQLLLSRAGLMTEATSAANFEFYGTKLSGTPVQRDRWKRAVAFTSNSLGEVVAQLYVSRHFPASSKDEMITLVDYLIKAYHQRISNLEWMTAATKEKALIKLSKFRAKIGYPDRWRSFAGLQLQGDLLTMARTVEQFNHDFELQKLGKDVDRDEWVMMPQTVNACYHPVVNDITFPAAVLQPPFFDPAADMAINFGAIGAVIGHEIGHGFDDQGSLYDGDGNLISWWTDEDRAAFEQLTKGLVAQYQGRVPAGVDPESGASVNGEFTLGENIGDLGGLGIAIEAYRLYLADQGLTPETAPREVFEVADSNLDPATEWTAFQRLFISWARIWRSKARPEMAAQLLAVDPHSPAEFRANITAANVPEFHEAFPDLDPILPPEQRVTIW